MAPGLCPILAMKTLHFSTRIQAPAHRVWQTLWSDPSYGKWSSVFAEGSHLETDWSEGSRIYFLDGKNNGVYSIIQTCIPNRHLSVINLGELFEGREQVIDERTSAGEWSGAMENYYLNEKNGITALWVEMEADRQHAPLFAEKFPIALEKVKVLAEEALQTPALLWQQSAMSELRLAV